MFEWINIQEIWDARGRLRVLEQGDQIPFEMKRVYLISDPLNEAARGFHAHIRLQQVMVCLQGQCDLRLDDGEQKAHICLKSGGQGVWVKPWTWRELAGFSEDCLLMVLASEPYDEDDYIRDYETFLAKRP